MILIDENTKRIKLRDVASLHSHSLAAAALCIQIARQQATATRNRYIQRLLFITPHTHTPQTSDSGYI